MNLKWLIFFSICHTLILNGFSQSSVIINRQKGIIFNGDVKFYFFHKYEKRIELSKDDIIKSESILEKKYPLLKNAKYKRQYIGFLNDLSQKIVFVNLIDGKVKKKHIQNWKKELIIGNGDFYDKYTNFHYINLISEDVD